MPQINYRKLFLIPIIYVLLIIYVTYGKYCDKINADTFMMQVAGQLGICQEP